ncbi:hypothetical protein Cfor_04017 [Coptotermes formosanus]|uniref:Ig-like domain-containing protein n=1 Tax=Coptotermes formosanus TaxID=36987 RepID=A0A6L2Q6X9_COPFO|nr:hypothetical protein Cfor_04017 [Coptotermes formosanus]
MSRFIVELKLPRYVMVGDSALLQCDHNVRMEHLHRVNWLRNGKKIFQFVKGRTPPFSNFSIPGAELDQVRHNLNRRYKRGENGWHPVGGCSDSVGVGKYEGVQVAVCVGGVQN